MSKSVRAKISKTLTGRKLSEAVKTNHILGAHKKKVYCYDWESNKLLMEFEGIRIMARVVNRNSSYIRQKLASKKPFFCNIQGISYKLLLKSKQ